MIFRTLLTHLLVFVFATLPALADINARNGVTITTASTINGITPVAAINGIPIGGGFFPYAQGFEETGVPTGWTGAGDVNFDDTSASPPQGAEDFKVSGPANAFILTGTPATDAVVYFAFKTGAHPAGGGVAVYYWDDPSYTGFVNHNADGTLTVQYKPGVTATTVDAVPSFSWVYIKVRITPTQASVEFSGTKTFTGSGNAFAITTGSTGGGALTVLYLATSGAAGSFYAFDDVYTNLGNAAYP